jgi:hypothetical protein
MLRHSPVLEWAETVLAPGCERGGAGISGFYKMFHFVECVLPRATEPLPLQCSPFRAVRPKDRGGGARP